MSQKSNTIAGIIFFVVWLIIVIAMGASKNIKPDITSDGGYEPARTFGHPLYQDY